MRLKKKLILLCSMLVLLSLGLLVPIVHGILVGSYDSIDQASARKTIQSASKALANDIDQLSILMQNFSAWDDTYDFIKKNAPDSAASAYLVSNYPASTFTTNHLNLILLLDNQGRMRYGGYYDLQKLRFEPLPPAIANLRDQEALTGLQGPTDLRKGLMTVEGRPMIVLAQPIVTSDFAGPSAGTMIVGRYFDQNEQEKLSARLGFPLHLMTLPGHDQSTILVETLSETELRVSEVFPSLTGDASFRLSTVQPRQVYVEGVKTIVYIFGTHLLIGLSAGIVGFRWTNRNIINRLTTIIRAMKKIGKTSDFRIRIPLSGKDEIGSLEKMFNNMMIALESSQQSLLEHANTDPLTQLANRTVFFAELERSIARAEVNGEMLAVLFLDLDHFKKINDTYGHGAGDTLLVVIADRLRSCVRDQDLVSRLAGDEFTVLVRGCTDGEEVHRIIDCIRKTLRAPIEWEGKSILVTASIGYALYPEFDVDAQRLVQNADRAMYIVKSNGRDRVQQYTEQVRREQDAAELYESELWLAVQRGELHLEYQPIVHLESGEVQGMEALVRWKHHQFGTVPPTVIIPIAERTGSIQPIGRWILETACADLRSLADLDDELYVSVNISPRQLKQDDFVEVCLDTIGHSGVDAGRLYFEITETELMTDLDSTFSKLQALRDQGIKISIDDFGTGYSSLAYLKKLPLDTLKIDKSFIDRIDHRNTDQQIARMIIKLGELLGLNVIAEGIETRVQADVLLADNCPYGQGYLYSKPLTLDQLRATLKQSDRLSNTFQ